MRERVIVVTLSVVQHGILKMHAPHKKRNMAHQHVYYCIASH